MSKATFSLETLSVASPCHAPWGNMSGDDRVRFCGECRRHVYNLSEMSRSEAESLVQCTEGRLCVRFYQRSDGKVMTSDCPVGLESARRRVMLAVSAGVATFLLALGWALTLLGSSAKSQANARRFRDIEPIRTVMELLDPTPPIVMGAICVPTPPPQGNPVVPPEAVPDDLPPEQD